MTFKEKTLGKYTVTDETRKWLVTYMNESAKHYETKKTITPELVAALKPFRLAKPTKIYRGLYYPGAAEYYKYKPFDAEIGSSFLYKEAKISSWSKDLKVAEGFATNADFGFVLECMAKPEDTLFDMQSLPRDMCDTLQYGCDEKEVVLLPGEYKIKVKWVTTQLQRYLDKEEEYQ